MCKMAKVYVYGAAIITAEEWDKGGRGQDGEESVSSDTF